MKETPDVSGKETPDVSGKETPDISGKETPDVSGKETPDVSGKETPDISGYTLTAIWAPTKNGVISGTYGLTSYCKDGKKNVVNRYLERGSNCVNYTCGVYLLNLLLH